MKRIGKILVLSCLSLMLMLSGILVACKSHKLNNDPPIPPSEEGLTLNRTAVELDLHEEAQLSVVDEGTGTIRWSSSDNAIATVDANGLVRSVAAGTAIVTAYRDNKTGKCTVTVVNSFAAPIITFSEASVSADKNEQKHIAASVLYKGNPVADAGELTFSVADVLPYENTTVTTITNDADGKGVTLNCAAYGEAALTATATVWGIPVTSTLPIRVVNSAVSISTAITDKDGENYTVTINAIDVTYHEQNVSVKTVDPQLSVSVNGAPVVNPDWTVLDDSAKHVAHYDASSGKITADDDCDIDTETLTFVCNGNSVKFDVTTEKAEIALAEADKWDMELKDKTEIDVSITDLNAQQLSGIDIKGAIEKVEIPYKVIAENNGNMSVDNTQRNIFKSFDSGTNTVTLTPPVQAYNMGDMTATVTTTKAIYLVPVGIYTLKISTPDELDKFADYTTHQWSDPYLWDGYFVLDKDITYNASLTEVTATTRAFEPFIWAERRRQEADGVERYFDENCTVNVNTWNTGFIGVFDGRGHTIDGFVVDASSGEKYRNEHENGIDPNEKTRTEWGGFIGKLGAAAFGDNLRRGTIRNISFRNAIHGGGVQGTWGGFLYSMSLGGRVENVYIQSKMIGSNGFFGGTEWLVQSSAMRNVVLDVVSESGWNADYALGTVHNWSSADFAYLQNLYTVRPTRSSNYSIHLPATIKNTENTPHDAFANKQALGDYLADNGLLVSAANGWDMDFWTTDEYGAPIPKSLVGTGDTITTLAMSTASVQTFDGFKPHTYGWNVDSDTAVTFASSNDNVVTVSPEGVLVAVGRGEATVTATPAQGAAKTLTVTVTDAYEGAKGFMDHVAIASVADIERLAAETDTSGKKYVLACDINLNGRVGSIAHDFKGVFHGNGYALKNGKLQIQNASGDAKKRTLFSGTTNGATICNLKITGLETMTNSGLDPSDVNQTGWDYIGVLDNSEGNCIVENVYIRFTVNTNGDGTIGDATFGRPTYVKFTNVIVDVTYTGNFTNYASLFIGAYANGNTLTDVYAIVHTQGDAVFAEIKDTINTQSSNGLQTSSARNYASLDALREAHGECFTEGGAFTGTFWDGILQA